mmetsp:Transcript_83061/g.166215  ORF Transcript_83061/g.166215 Transcript_83061/m.166215 type:complete len:115 (-) Transcript_83061:200-544(-)
MGTTAMTAVQRQHKTHCFEIISTATARPALCFVFHCTRLKQAINFEVKRSFSGEILCVLHSVITGSTSVEMERGHAEGRGGCELGRCKSFSSLRRRHPAAAAAVAAVAVAAGAW